jgi:hypothetical protein
VAAPQPMAIDKGRCLGTAFSFLIPSSAETLEQEGQAVTKILDEVLVANAKYAENFGDKGNLPLPPSRHFAIFTVWMPALIWLNTPV